MSAAKLMFAKQNINTYVYVFWITRSLVGVFKNQVIFSFVHVFHACSYIQAILGFYNNSILGINIFLFILIIGYEFLVSISPVAPTEPAWTFMEVTASANSLSRTNLCNIFVIFLDGLISVVYHSTRYRSKFVFLKKESTRDMVEISAETEKKLLPLWKVYGASGLIVTIIFFSEFIYPLPKTVYNVGFIFVL